MDGVYLPWTYDAKTDTEYDGQKETHYYETERRQGKTVHVRKTSWESVSATTLGLEFPIQEQGLPVHRQRPNGRAGGRASV